MMTRHTMWLALLAIGLLAFGCGTLNEKDSKPAKTSGKGKAVGGKAVGGNAAGGNDAGAKAAGGKPAGGKPAAPKGPRTPANRIELFTMTATGPKDKPWQDFGGTFDMKTAIFTWTKDEVYLQFGNDPGGCDYLKGGGNTSKSPLRVTVIVPLSPAQRKGAEPLDGKTVKAKRAVIYARHFNSMFLMGADAERTVHFVSGRVKPGETIKGRVLIKEPFVARNKHALIKGNFELKVCKP